MNAFGHNLRSALRQLRKSPGFSLTVVLTLAFGIGATTAIFSLVEGILLRPLPFSDPDRLVLVGDHLGNSSTASVSAREIETYSKATKAFSSMGGYLQTAYELSGETRPEQVQAARMTMGAFPTLAVSPIVGRVFTQQEEDSHEPVAVISYSLWMHRYHTDQHVLGQSVVLDRRAYSIIGVMPRSFEFPLQPGHLNQVQIWVPMSFTANDLSEQQAGLFGYHIVARLNDGVTVAQAALDADRVSKQIMLNFPPSMKSLRIRGDARSLRESVVQDTRPLLRTLFLAVGVVLVIACVNVAGLLLVRAIRRRGEYAVRLALGARSTTVMRECLAEGLALSIVGGLLGLAFAAIVVRVALRLLPESMPRVDAISIDAGVAAFALLLALATGVLCSLAPAFAALRTNLSESLKEGIRTGTGGSSHSRLRSALVVSEIAIALVLLTTSGAFLRSLQKMREIDPGFNPDHVLVAAYQLPLRQYSTIVDADNFHRDVIDRLSSQPSVIAAGITTFLPSTDYYGRAGYTLEDEPIDTWKLKFTSFDITYGEYFRAMKIPLIAGRYFTTDDRPDSVLAVIVNQSMAKHSWPGQQALGKRLHVGNPQKGLPWATVVGVVADTSLGSRDEPSDDQMYFPAQQPAALLGSNSDGRLPGADFGNIVLRSELPPEEMSESLRAAVAKIDPQLALQQIQPMNAVISNVETPRRFNTDLITSFAIGALLLAVTGIYAVMAFSVSLRTQEIAIRMALGSQREGIARLVLGLGAKLALIGCAVGVIGSIAISRLVTSFLFKVSPTDPLIYTAAVVLMMLMALLASMLPAIRAASADPIRALRAA